MKNKLNDKIDTCATTLAAQYIANSLPVEHEAFSASQIPAYHYLARSWLTRQVALKGEEVLDDAETQEKLRTELFPGLTRYFYEANYFQEALIDVSVKAAEDTILAESLLMRLSPAPERKGRAVLESISGIRERVQSALNAVYPDEKLAVPQIDLLLSPLHSAALKHYEASEAEKAITYRALIGAIDVFMAQLNRPGHLEIPGSQITKEARETFRDARKRRTVALNEYENTLQTALKEAKNAPAWEAIEQRLEELEAYRNGYLTALPEQSATLTTVPIEDLSELHRTMEQGKHPALKALGEHVNGMRNLTVQANKEALKDPPSLYLKESGIKSWRRTIDKLVDEKEGDWSTVNDLARINPTFRNPETMFLYNHFLRKAMHARGWELNAPKNKPYNDRGVFVKSSGSMLWLMHAKATVTGKEPMGVEVKLDDEKQREIETFTHKIFECARILEDDNGEINGVSVKLNFPRFLESTLREMKHLQTHTPFPENQDINERITTILNTTMLYQRIGVLPDELLETALDLRQQLHHLHAAFCCEAACHSSPGMAALFELQVKKTNDPELNAIYALHTPQKITDEHRARVAMLVEAFDKSWAQEQEADKVQSR